MKKCFIKEILCGKISKNYKEVKITALAPYPGSRKRRGVRIICESERKRYNYAMYQVQEKPRCAFCQ